MKQEIKSLKFKKNPFHDRILFKEIQLGDRKYTQREYRDRYFFPDEWKVFFDQLKDRQKLTFTFLINTGARISETAGVVVKDVDFDRLNIVFRLTKSRNKDGSRRIRTIPISSQFAKFLKGVIRDYNLGLEDKFPILSIPASNIAMKKALQLAQIPDWRMFSVHNVRKTTEMYLMALGVPSEKIEKHMGHSLVVAMRFYVSPDIFSFEDRSMMRDIIGDLYQRKEIYY